MSDVAVILASIPLGVAGIGKTRGVVQMGHDQRGGAAANEIFAIGAKAKRTWRTAVAQYCKRL